jgi:HD-GYP domain-containing protein (c-di-GMP phosphodiesterase class II)
MWKMVVVEDKSEPARREADATTVAQAVWESDGDVDAVERALSDALREFDADTADHCRTTVRLSGLVARRLDADHETVRLVERVAALHDIGKLGVPLGLLLKPGPLAPDEAETMREHSEIGGRIIASVPAMSEIADAVRHEHERWDGGGYPDGFAAEEIPLASRIVFACDAWHAMTSRRPYRLPLARSEAMWELQVGSGGQFDPGVVDALLGLLNTGGERAA